MAVRRSRRELGDRWQQHPARTSAVTALVVPLRPGSASRQVALKDQQKTALVYHMDHPALAKTARPPSEDRDGRAAIGMHTAVRQGARGDLGGHNLLAVSVVDRGNGSSRVCPHCIEAEAEAETNVTTVVLKQS
jgi:hypothetical protein